MSVVHRQQLSNFLIGFETSAYCYNVINSPFNEAVLNFQKSRITESLNLLPTNFLISQYKFKEHMMEEIIAQQSSL